MELNKSAREHQSAFQTCASLCFGILVTNVRRCSPFLSLPINWMLYSGGWGGGRERDFKEYQTLTSFLHCVENSKDIGMCCLPQRVSCRLTIKSKIGSSHWRALSRCLPVHFEWRLQWYLTVLLCPLSTAFSAAVKEDYPGQFSRISCSDNLPGLHPLTIKIIFGWPQSLHLNRCC